MKTSDDRRPALRPEAQLLLCCARTNLPAGQREQVAALLRQDLDWNYLTRLAGRHGLVPLLYRHLEAIDPTAVPKPVFGRLWGQAQANARRNVAMTEELLRLLPLLEAEGIAAVPFKGPALAALVYGDVTLREFVDLDLLVRKQEVRRAKAILEAQGYQFAARLSPAQERAYLHSRNHHHFQLVRAEGQVALELHWEVAPLAFFPAIEVDQLWSRLEPLVLDGATVNGFAAEDHLLLLCMHGAKHGWGQLEWLAGVAELLRLKPDLAWDEVLAQARQLHSSRMLLLGLHLAQELLGTTLPPVVQAKLRHAAAIQQLAAQVRSHLFEEEGLHLQPFSRVSYHMRVMDRRVDRIRYGLSTVTAPTVIDWQGLPLPASLAGLYRLLRPLRLAGKYGLGLLKSAKLC